jgi:hypothetical protein
MSFSFYFFWYFVSRADWWDAVIVLLVALFPLLLSRAVLTRASIVVDERGISTQAFGIKTRSIAWNDVKKIMKVRVSNGYSYVDNFSIQDKIARIFICRLFINFCGNVVFSQDIRDLRYLLDEINFYARRYKIPLFVLDAEGATATGAARGHVGYWKRAKATILEVRVEKF